MAYNIDSIKSYRLDRKPMLKEDLITPLMAKLSMTESYSFAASTESVCRTPSTNFQPQSNADSHKKLLLFVAGFQHTSLMVLLEKEAENDADLIHQLVSFTVCKHLQL